MESYVIIVLLFGIICMFLLIGVYFVGRIFGYKDMIDNNFIAVSNIISERINIIDDMVKFLESNLEYEKSYKRELIKTKEQLNKISNNKEGIDLIVDTDKMFVSFNKLENTYNKLSKNKEYLMIKTNVSNNMEKLEYSFDVYNKGVNNYNTYREKRFIYLLSKLCGIPEYGYYKK